MGTAFLNRYVVFLGPRQVQVEEEVLPPPAAGQVVVRITLTAISAGTEMLFYRGLFPKDLPVDATLPALQGQRPGYPLRYGYAAVGYVEALGPQVPETWRGRRVFAFLPHQRRAVVEVGRLLPVPEDIPDADAVFLPNMETAVNFLHDAAPLLGERVAVFGQGVVGLLTTGLLARFPLERLVTFEGLPLRQEASRQAGAHEVYPPQAAETMPPFADLTLELSGNPQALDAALAVTLDTGRVILGSWYGEKPVRVRLGGRFHRSRIQILSSQVSTLAPHLRGRWDKARRFAVAWQALRWLRPSCWITHRFPLDQAPQAYRLLDAHPDRCLQVVLEP